MKKLMGKELQLCINAQLVIFVAMAVLVMIPSWPPAAGFIYAISGIATIFPRTLANKDMEYTALLPVRKRDIVTGKTLLVCIAEIVSLLVAAGGSLLRNFVFNVIPEDAGSAAYSAAVAPNFSLFGFTIFAYGLVNLILLPLYYRDPYKKLTAPMLLSLFGFMAVEAAASLLVAFVPVFRNYDQIGWITQLSTLGGGIIAFVLLTLLGMVLAQKKFEKIDL
ncbi:MAG: ABC-2 transporter permease [Bacilli bacterium]|nr:ABC-2 transporter permease [Bacilli bacterium]